MNKIKQERQIVSKCYDHIGGYLGEIFLNFLIKDKWIQKNEENYSITEKGWDQFERLGLKIEELRSKKIITVCIEKHHGIFHEHIGAHLGALLTNRLFELGWLEKKDNETYQLTNQGITGLESFGIDVQKIISSQNNESI